VPVLKLVSIEEAATDLSRSLPPPRGLGWAKGQVTIEPDFAGSLDDFADHR
jgi:hypothetical protein